MKKFTFPLDRVMEFRRMQARLEEVRLEALYAELRAVEAQEAALIAEKTQAEKALRNETSVTGFELERFAAFSAGTEEQRKRIEKSRAACRKRIEAQLAVLAAKRRDVKLLEHLKEQRLETWEMELSKEIDQQAEEAYLAKWNLR